MEDSFLVVACCVLCFLGPHCCKALVLGLVDFVRLAGFAQSE